MALLSWRVVHDGKTPPPGAVVRADERLSWPRTVGLGAQHGDSPDVTGAILVAGVVLAACCLIIQMLGSRVVYAVLPPVVTGAVVMLIGFNLAPVVANIYWPQDQWVALFTMVAVMAMAVGFRGFLGRIAVFLGLVVGYALSWIFDRVFGQITSFDAAANQVTIHFRVN